MDCRSVINSLSDYLDGLLEPQHAHRIEIHLSDCPPCHGIKVDLHEIRTAARELPFRTPSGMLWTRIEREISVELLAQSRQVTVQDRARGWWRGLSEKRFTLTLPQLVGTGVLAASLVAFGLVSKPFKPATVSTAVLTGEDVLKQQINHKASVISTRKASWDPQMQVIFDNSLRRIDDSLSNCQQSLAGTSDRDQQQMLIELYKEKLQLLDDFEKLK